MEVVLTYRWEEAGAVLQQADTRCRYKAGLLALGDVNNGVHFLEQIRIYEQRLPKV